jgi:hypothetical protein
MGVLDSFLFDTTRGDNPVDSNLTGDTKPANKGKVVDLLTTQSLTWTTAITVIGLLWAFAQQQIREGANPAPWTLTPLVPIIIAGAVMAAALLASWSALTGWPAKASALIVAGLNTLLLVANFFVATGIQTKTP